MKQNDSALEAGTLAFRPEQPCFFSVSVCSPAREEWHKHSTHNIDPFQV